VPDRDLIRSELTYRAPVAATTGLFLFVAVVVGGLCWASGWPQCQGIFRRKSGKSLRVTGKRSPKNSQRQRGVDHPFGVFALLDVALARVKANID
jgi:hypothetical protein